MVKACLQLKVTLDGKRKKFPTDFAVKPSEWDSKNHNIKPSVHNAAKYNILIERFKNRCNEIIVNMMLQGRPVTFQSINYELYGKKGITDFCIFFQKYLENNKARWSPGTYMIYKTELSKLKKFKESIPFHEITHELVLSYENYMINTLNNKVNTVGKTFKKIKPVIADAIRAGYLNKNPFENYKVRHEPTNRDFLTIEEVNKLQRLHPCNDSKLNNVLEYFLFACYTGLRYLDVRDLRWGNFSSGYLNIVMNKTGEQIMIPLTSKAVKLMGKPQEPDKHVFRVLSNQKTNDYLKLIQSKVELNKTLSFHIARHTFATISLNLGIPTEVVSKLLGHNNLKTTQIYAKLLDSTKFEQKV